MLPSTRTTHTSFTDINCFVLCITGRQLACDRITIHKNLFISYILSGLAWILYYSLAALNVHVLETNPVSRLLITILNVSGESKTSLAKPCGSQWDWNFNFFCSKGTKRHGNEVVYYSYVTGYTFFIIFNNF